MKIIKPEKHKQFNSVRIVCSDRVMAEVLNSSPDRGHWMITEEYFAKVRRGEENGFEWLFRSGAKLKVDTTQLGQKSRGFYIFGYAQSGSDAAAAVLELEFLYALREAHRKYELLQVKLDRYHERRPTLAVRVVWPPQQHLA